MAQRWSPADYQRHAAFVPALGQSILKELAARQGERILDLGCGDGTLTAQIAVTGARVVGVDASPAMVAAAADCGLDARLMDVRALTFAREFDAVFSNAALHWVPEADLVIAGVARSLTPGGRFVAEFGGHGNVAAITVALRAVFAAHGLRFESPWFYPTPAEYRTRLEAHGFEVRDIRLLPRPTMLPGGMDGWLQTFAAGIFETVPAALAPRMMAEVVELLRPSLCDGEEQWTADYVRLQCVATLPPAGTATCD